MTTAIKKSTYAISILDAIPVIKIHKDDLYFDVLDSCLIIGDEMDAVTDEIITKWNKFRSQFGGIIVSNTTKPHIPESLGFVRHIDDGTNYRFVSRP